MSKARATEQLSTILEERITNYYTKLPVDEIGRVVSVGDGIARVYGSNKIQAGRPLVISTESMHIRPKKFN